MARTSHAIPHAVLHPIPHCQQLDTNEIAQKQPGRRQATRVEPRNDCRPRPHACFEELGKTISWDLSILS